VLLMDEWFLAGDFTFMDKARARLEDMVSRAEILVLSSHQHDTVAAWCTRVIWLDHGRVREDGEAEPVIERYLGRPLKQGQGAALDPPGAEPLDLILK
jgi:lipopolysaccharide transport system ATP-binding protein